MHASVEAKAIATAKRRMARNLRTGSPAAHFIRRDAGERTAISDAIIEFDQLYADTIAKKQGDLLL